MGPHWGVVVAGNASRHPSGLSTLAFDGIIRPLRRQAMNRELEDYYAAVLEDLESDKAELDRLIAYIKRKKFGQGEEVQDSSQVSSAAHFSGSVISRPATGVLSISAPDAFFGLGLIEAAKKYLAAAKAPRSAKEIAQALVAGGFTTTSKDFNNTVFSVLSRENKQDGGIVKVNTGWGLPEWYPGLRRSKSQNKPAMVPHDIFPEDAESKG